MNVVVNLNGSFLGRGQARGRHPSRVDAWGDPLRPSFALGGRPGRGYKAVEAHGLGEESDGRATMDVNRGAAGGFLCARKGFERKRTTRCPGHGECDSYRLEEMAS